MFKTRISNKNTTYGIIGLGRFGESLALSLANSGAEFMVIDKARLYGKCLCRADT